jgi:hypothetical protein
MEANSDQSRAIPIDSQTFKYTNAIEVHVAEFLLA